jgi:hypothetical protein
LHKVLLCLDFWKRFLTEMSDNNDTTKVYS